MQPETSASRANASETKARGANRSTKLAGKLKVLPEESELTAPGQRLGAPVPPKDQGERLENTADSEDGDDEEEEEEDEDDVKVYNQISLIPDGTARRDALKLTKGKAKSLPRVTAYATARSYRLPEITKFFDARRISYHTDPILIDDVIYTPYVYDPTPSYSSHSRQSSNSRSRLHSQSHSRSRTGDLLGIPELHEGSHGDNESGPSKKRSKFDTASAAGAEIFIFGYGTVVLWGMTEAEEKRFLASIKRFEIDKLAPEDVEMENLNFYYADYSRIYNDVITLRKGSSYMTKLSLSHALSQSVKISVFEELISATIEDTKDIPEVISETGKIGMPHKEIMMKIGELFLLRTNINSVGSVLDSPEVFWSYPDLQPLYEAARSYLEIPQRINLLNTRVEVLQDMLQLLKESVSNRHAQRLEQVVIVLIAIEILLGIITILVDLFA